MVSSDSSTCRAASPSGMKLSRLATRSTAREAMGDKCREHALANATGLAGLVDDEHLAGGPGFAKHVVHRQRCQPPQVDDTGA